MTQKLQRHAVVFLISEKYLEQVRNVICYSITNSETKETECLASQIKKLDM